MSTLSNKNNSFANNKLLPHINVIISKLALTFYVDIAQHTVPCNAAEIMIFFCCQCVILAL